METRKLTQSLHDISLQKVHARVSKKIETWAEGGEPPCRLNPQREEQSPQIFQAKPVPPSTGVLHLLRYETSDMPTICHKSMTWLLYFKAMMNAYPSFHVETQYVDYDPAGMDDVVVPRLVTVDDQIYNNLEDFNRRSGLTLDIKTRNPMTKVEHEAVQKIEDRKRIVSEHLMSLEEALVYGYNLLGPQEEAWTVQSVFNIKQKLEIDADDILQQKLMQNMRNACQSLSEVLGNKTFFLDDLRIECANETNLFDKYHLGLSTLTTVDVKHAAVAMLIMKCFEDDGPQDLSYTYAIKRLLHRHIALWSHAERLYSAHIKEKLQAQDYDDSRDGDDHIAQALEGRPQAFGKFGDVYKVFLPEGSDWKLPQGYYAFKFANAPSSRSHIECEVGTLQNLPPYDFVANLLGYGFIDNKMFLITKWQDGGDLETRIQSGDLTWEEVKNILKGIAYALHMIHRTQICIVDLKPANILLNEAHDPILCDMGVAAGSGSCVEGHGTQTYHDDSRDATPQRDVFGYGVILFRMVSNEVDTQVCGRLIGERIVPLIEKEESIEEIIKKLRGMGCPDETTATLPWRIKKTPVCLRYLQRSSKVGILIFIFTTKQKTLDFAPRLPFIT